MIVSSVRVITARDRHIPVRSYWIAKSVWQIGARAGLGGVTTHLAAVSLRLTVAGFDYMAGRLDVMSGRLGVIFGGRDSIAGSSYLSAARLRVIGDRLVLSA